MYKGRTARARGADPIWLCLLLLIAHIPAAAFDPDFATKTDALLEAEALPGIAWAAYGDKGAIAGASGLADIEESRPMTPNTRVQVGSVTKTLLSLGVLRLVSEETLALEDEVESLLPMLNWRNPWRAQAPVTVRHLLEHTAGLDNIRLWQFLNSRAVADMPLSEAFPPERRSLLRIRSRPGSQYSYSNMGYALLGMVIERVTGERYEDYLENSLLDPLGMEDSSFHLVTRADDARLAMGYLDNNVSQPAVPMILRPAGQFTTTANDMQRLLGFLLGDGSLDGSPFIAPALMAQIGQPSTTLAHQHGLAIGHGLALAGRDRHGVIGYCHPGTTFGFRAQLCLFPDAGKAFFYAINADRESADYERFTALFIQQLALQEVPAAVASDGAGVLTAHTGLYALSPNNMAQFAWLDWLFNSVWLRKSGEDGSLVMYALQQPARRLYPLGDGLYRDSQRRLASYVFIDDHTLSNGLMTWRRASLTTFLLGWASLVAGILGLLYIVIRGSVLLIDRRSRARRSLLLPYAGILAFALPAFLFARQSFLEFGEMTAASVLVAGLSATLPLLVIAALWRLRPWARAFRPDLLALIALLQLCLVMAYQGVLPLRIWV